VRAQLLAEGIEMIYLGKRFGRLLVIDVAPLSRSGHSRWVCLCDCGSIRTVFSTNLLRGFTVSCGCYQREVSTVHGLGYHPLIGLWRQMIRRCEDRRCKDFVYYGARGIRVCVRWRRSFANFIRDMGERESPLLTVDRVNNNGDYCPSSCRWSTRAEQARNRRPRAKL